MNPIAATVDGRRPPLKGKARPPYKGLILRWKGAELLKYKPGSIGSPIVDR